MIIIIIITRSKTHCQWIESSVQGVIADGDGAVILIILLILIV